MNRHELQPLLQQSYSRANWQKVLRALFPEMHWHVHPLSLSEAEQQVADEAFQLATLQTTESDGLPRKLAVYEVQLHAGKHLHRNRVELRNLLKSKWQDQDGALIVFYQPDRPNWRFTFVSEIVRFGEDTSVQTVATAPKRFTYFLGKNESCRTAAERFERLTGPASSLADLREAFSVEKLSKAFFNGYKTLYLDFVDYLTASMHKASVFNGDEKVIRDFCKKMLGRTVFLYFLQKKGWLGVPDGQDWGDGRPDFLHWLFKETGASDAFYATVLAPLFFETLNKARPDDRFKLDAYSEIDAGKVPYLNGGLFENDFPKADFLTFPPRLFERLFDFFDQYNFTVDEDNPEEHTVAVDPEMLGHIFENLLEDNKDKGAYYTPKSIVHYMCRESLIEYLTTHLNNVPRPDLEAFVRAKTVSGIILERAKDIDNLLSNVKICDPAIGSGAFPMGLLHEIFFARLGLLPHIRPIRPWHPAEEKEKIIQNSIYGVDIEKGAVDIARLRFWLSLIVDEEEPRPLPNLDYNILQGNSLLESFYGIDLTFRPSEKPIARDRNLFGAITNPQLALEDFLEQQANWPKLRHDLFHTTDPEQKKLLRDQLNEIEKAFIGTQIKEKIAGQETFIRSKAPVAHTTRDKKAVEQAQTQLVTWQDASAELRSLDPDQKPYCLWHLWFMEVFRHGGFDIVIGNPPYRQISKSSDSEKGELQRERYSTFDKSGDIYCLFYERGLHLLRPKGHLCYITSNSWMRTKYGEKLRHLFVDQFNPRQLVNIEDTQVFETAVVETNVILIQRSAFGHRLVAVALESDYDAKQPIEQYLAKNGVILSEMDEGGWFVGSAEVMKLKLKMESSGPKLGDWENKIYRGLTTGFNDGYFIESTSRDDLISRNEVLHNIIYPAFRGRDLEKYSANWANQWVVVLKAGWTNLHRGSESAEAFFKKKYPAFYQHLITVQEAKQKKKTTRKQKTKGLYERDDQGDFWWELRSCAYYSEFEKPKIIWGELSNEPKFSYDEKGHYAYNTVFLMTGNDLKFILAILNSQTGKWYFDLISTTSGMGTNRWLKYKVEQLPIPNPTTSIKTQVETLVDAVLDGKEHGEDTSALEEAIDRLVYQLYGLTDEEIAIVEGRPVVGSASITVPSDGQVAGWIKAGEAASARVEFKLGVFYNPHTGKKDGSMRNNIVEAVASFLNSQQGGTMLIGVADDGTVVGITEDIKAANPQKNSQDGYGLALSDLLAHRLQYGAISAHYRISYHDVRRQTVCAVSVIPTPEPIWLDGDLYVRDQHGKRKLNARAAQDYIKHRWE